MARQWRIEYTDALYHVLSRGNNGQAIVVDDRDRDKFLEVLGRMCSRFDVAILAYVLMDNHYHLLMQTKRANLSKSMQWLGSTYTRYFNLRHRQSGHLFQGRFKSFLIENDAYLLRVSYYIHRNPLRSKTVRRLVDYRWSSYRAYAYGKTSPPWLETATILSQFSDKEKEQAYRRKIQHYVGNKTTVWQEVKHGLIMGSNEFIQRIRNTYLTQAPDKEMPQQRKLAIERSAESLLQEAGVSIEKKDRAQRDLLIYALWEKGWYTNQDIGDIFGITYSAVSRRVTIAKEKIAKNTAYKRRYRQLKAQLLM